MPQRPADDSVEWLDFYYHQVVPFWQQVHSGYFAGCGDVRLHWCWYKVNETAPLIVISPGRIEATLKYQEVVWELAKAGISCAILDHRGQGMSQRLTDNPHQGHVDAFDDFVADFERFEREVTATFPHTQARWLVGHSMGGAISALYINEHSQRFDELVLTSPMFSINTGGIPIAIAKFVAASGAWLNKKLAPTKPWYFLGMKDYAPLAFEKNELTHSNNRYRIFREQYQQQPEVQLGGPTFNWLYEALQACEVTTAKNFTLNCPVTLFQAGADGVVSATGQQRFIANNKTAERHVIAGARHELLMESDRYRQPVMDKLLSIIE